MIRFAAFIVVISTPHVGAAQGFEVVHPKADTIVMDLKINVHGIYPGGAGKMIRLKAGTTEFGPVVVNKDDTWLIPNVDVPKGTTEWTLTLNPALTQHKILVTRGADIAKQPQQKIRFEWTPDVDAELEKIAVGTLTRTATNQVRVLTNVEKTAFLQGVKTQTVAAVLRAYRGIDLELVDAAGPGVHTLQMLSSSGSIFGQSFFDCGNIDQQQVSEIWVGTYRESMTQPGFEDDWSPMKPTDTLQQRIDDVGEALGRTAAHELGHSLGLVGSGLGMACGWMLGCDGGHNCESVDLTFSTAKRFNNGFFILDPGGRTFNNARIAEPFRNTRTTPRTPAAFNAFNRSYFAIVHPQ